MNKQPRRSMQGSNEPDKKTIKNLKKWGAKKQPESIQFLTRPEHEDLHNHCSICSTLNANISGQMITFPADYCPRCGAKLRRRDD